MSYESHIGKQLAFEGCIFTIKSLGMRNYRCSKLCVDVKLDEEDECGFCPIPIVKGEFSAFEVVLNVIVTNKADEDGWFVGNEDIKLIDDAGFAHPGFVLCEKIPYIQRANSCDRLKRRTQADMVYIFPNLDDKSRIVALQVNCGSSYARLELEKIPVEKDIFSDEAYEKVLARPGAPLPDNEGSDFVRRVESEEQAEMLLAKAHALQKLGNQLLDKYQGPKDSDTIDAIRVLRMTIRERLDAFEEERKTKYSNASGDVLAAVEEFQRIIDDLKERESSWARAPRRRKAPEPQAATITTGFEQRCIQLLTSLGYTDIKTTESQSPDSLRLSASRYGAESIVFCRTGVPFIDTPDIQNLAQAMAQAHTPRGLFITTGHFTRPAEFKAMSESIDLVDIDRLRSLGIDCGA